MLTTACPPKSSGPILVADDEVPDEARPFALGSIGAVYRVPNDHRGELRISAANEAVERLLPDTVRMFRYEPEAGWREIEGSKFDANRRELVAPTAKPGLVTGFGWSVDPALNLVQRFALDAQRLEGEAGPASIDAFIDGLRQGQSFHLQAAAGIRLLARTCTIKTWQSECTSCPQPEAGAVCPTSPCPAEGPCPCPEGCCFCRPSWLVIPERGLIVPPLAGRIRFPDVCPRGLSCPNRFEQNLIRPTTSLQNDVVRAQLDSLGLVRLTEPDLLEKLRAPFSGDPSPQPSLGDPTRPN